MGTLNLGGATLSASGGNWTDAPPGTIIQVVHAATDTHFTSTSVTPVSIVSASITPKSTSNKILIQYTAAVSYDAGAATANICILKNGAKIAASNNSNISSGEEFRSNKTYYDDGGATSGNTMNSLSGSFLDSPATTSAITYGVGGYSNTTTGTCAFNRRATDATYGQVTEIILMEVAQ